MGWSEDINTFERWKKFLSGVKTPAVRQRVIGHMREIQQRWPRYIKSEEVPDD